jgi:hypothetical protein
LEVTLEAQALQIKAALDALTPTHAKSCGWYAGEVTAQGLAEELSPDRALFLAYEGEQLDDELSEVTTSGAGSDVALVVWRVYCVVSDQRSTKAALVTTGLPGLLALTSAVKGALNRLRFTGDAAVDVVSAAHMQLINDRPVLFQRGVALAHAVRFGYLRAVEQFERDALAGTSRLRGVDHSINTEPDGTHNPLANGRNTFT